MGFFEIFLIGIGLSMDAFAVSICKGLNMNKVNYRHAGIIALFFGGFQAIMPLIGWVLGKQFERYITNIDHWVAFVLLLFIGGNMLRSALTEEEGCCCEQESKLDYKELVMMGIATSIDALAIGITLAFLQVSILPSITIIGITTFVISFSGVIIGNYFGLRYKKKAEICGGIILILIGVKILLEHLGLFIL